MEENKIDPYQIIGFVLLIAAFFWWFNYTIPKLNKNIRNLIKEESISSR